MKKNNGWSFFEKRVEKLIQESADVPLNEVMKLLKKADSKTEIDLKKEIFLIRRKIHKGS